MPIKFLNTVAVDTSVLYVDTINDRVGIGTTSPSSLLHLSSAGSTVLNIEATGANDSRLRITAGNSNISYVEFADPDDVDTGEIRYEHATNNMQFRTAGNTERMRIDSSGNVGIGTAPDSDTELHVYRNGSAARVRVEREFNPKLDLESLNGYAQVGTLNNFPLAFQTNGSERIRVTSTGNVGIGTTSPGAKLDVNGAGNFSGGTVVSGIDTNTSVGVALAQGKYLYSDDGNYLRKLIGHNLNNSIDIGQGGTSLISDIKFFPGVSGNIIFYASGSENMRVNSTGKVGIGTTNPLAALDVNSNVHIDTYAAGTTVAHDAGYIKLLCDAKTGWAPGDELGKIEFYSTDASGIGTRNAASIRAVNNQGNGSSTTTFEGELAFYTSLYNTAEAEAVRIDSAGNVGIGTTSPSAKLSVNGTTQLAGEVSLPSTGTATASVNYPSQTLRFTTSAWDTNNSVARDVHWNIRNEGSSTIYPDGTLAFYEESPSYNHWKLKLPGRGSGSTYIHPDAALFNGRVNIYESDTSNINISLHPGGDSYFNGGNVGIGTTSPDVKLEVIDASPTDGIVADFVNSTNAGGTTAAIKLSNADSEACDVILGANRIGANFGSDFFISLSDSVDGSNQERFRITEAGNVGIGTSSFSGKLSVYEGGSGVYFTRLNGDNGTSGPALAFANDSTKSIIASTGDGIVFRTRAVGGAAFSGSEKMRITSGGDVGIGTTSPNAKLNITAGDNGTALLLEATDGTNTWKNITFKTYVSQSQAANFSDSSHIYTTSPGGATEWPFTEYGALVIEGRDNGNSGIALRTGNGSGQATRIAIRESGNVGIGTTGPATKLHVGSTSTSGVTTEEFRLQSGTSSGNGGTAIANLVTGNFGTSGIYFGNSSTYTSQDSYLKYSDSNNATVLGFSSSLNLEQGAIGSIMYINSIGNVGIGTTSPSSKLHVSGAIQNDQFIIPNTAGSNGQVLKWPASGTTLEWGDASGGGGDITEVIAGTNLTGGGTSGAVTLNMATGGIGSGTYGSTADGTKIDNITVDAYGRVTAITTGATGSGNGTVTGSGTTNYVSKWTSSTAQGNSTIYDNGNVGIGTTSPGETLTLQTQATGLGSEGIFIKNPFAGSSPIVNSKSPFLSLATSNTSAYNSTIYMGRNATATNQESKIEWSNANEALSIYVAGQGSYREHVRFGNLSSGTPRTYFGGNVGIGTTSPATDLEIEGGDHLLQLSTTSSTGSPYLSFNQAGTRRSFIQHADGGDTLKIASEYGGIGFFTGTSGTETQKITIQSGGNVGIGDTAPDAKLTVFRTDSTYAVNLSDTESRAGLSVKSSSNFDSKLTISSGASSRQYIQAVNNAATTGRDIAINPYGGNVGIGITSPAYDLEVDGMIAATTSTANSASKGFAMKNGNYGTNKINSYYGAWVSSVSMYIGGYLGYSYQPIAASAFNVNSDYRLKSNVGPLENAISRLNQLEVHRFNWNDKLDDPKVDGFIAHEVKEIVPEAVTGEKDELWPDGNPKYQGIDQAKLVPLLTAALKEAITKIETLETRIQTLENK